MVQVGFQAILRPWCGLARERIHTKRCSNARWPKGDPGTRQCHSCVQLCTGHPTSLGRRTKGAGQCAGQISIPLPQVQDPYDVEKAFGVVTPASEQELLDLEADLDEKSEPVTVWLE